MRYKICILHNSNENNLPEAIFTHYLPSSYKIIFTDKLPSNPNEFAIIIPWNYKKVIENADKIDNLVVMHSSHLPEGRGWAPIYYAFKHQKQNHIISAIKAVNLVDAGDVILRASFRIEDWFTASILRRVDEEINVLMIKKILNFWPNGSFEGSKQSGYFGYNQRRRPQDNEVDINDRINKLIPHLRGVEKNHPAFFYYNNVKFIINIEPEKILKKPVNVIFEYPATGRCERLDDWIPVCLEGN